MKRGLVIIFLLLHLVHISICSTNIYGIFQHEQSVSAYASLIGKENASAMHTGIWLNDNEGLSSVIKNMEDLRKKVASDHSSKKIILSDTVPFRTEMIKELIGQEESHVYSKFHYSDIYNDNELVIHNQDEHGFRVAEGMLQLLSKSSYHQEYIAIFVDDSRIGHRSLCYLIENLPFFDLNIIAYDIFSNISERTAILEVSKLGHSAIYIDYNGREALKIFKLAEELGVPGLYGDKTWILSQRTMDSLPLKCYIPSGSYYGIKLENETIGLAHLGKNTTNHEEKGTNLELGSTDVKSYQLWIEHRKFLERSWKPVDSFDLNEVNEVHLPSLPRMNVSIALADAWTMIAKWEHTLSGCKPGGRKGTRVINGHCEFVCFYGFSVDILQLLEERVGFVGVLKLSTDGKFGSYDEENGTMTGIISDIVTGEGDLGIDLSEDKNRLKVLEFTTPYLIFSLEIAYLQQYKLKEALLFGPFSPQLWLGTIGAIVVLVVACWILERASPYGHYQVKKRTVKHSAKFDLVDSANFVMGTFFTGEIIKEKPGSFGNRVTAIMVSIVSILIISTYSANLITFLVVMDETPIVDGIFDPKLIDETSRIRVGIVESTIAVGYLKTHSDLRIRRMYKDRTSEFSTLNDAVSALKRKEIDVIICDDISLLYIQSLDQDCDIKVMRARVAELGVGITMRKKFIWKKKFNAAVVDIVNSGLVDDLSKKWFRSQKCTRSNTFSSLDAKMISSIFVWLSIGILSCVSFCIISVLIQYLRSSPCTQYLYNRRKAIR